MLNFANCAVCNFSPVCMCQYCYPTSPCLSVSGPVKIAILAKILCLSSLLFLQRVADAVGDEPSLCQSQHNFSAHQATYTSFRTAFCMRKLSWILLPATPASIEPDTKYAPSYLMAGAIPTWLNKESTLMYYVSSCDFRRHNEARAPMRAAPRWPQLLAKTWKRHFEVESLIPFATGGISLRNFPFDNQ